MLIQIWKETNEEEEDLEVEAHKNATLKQHSSHFNAYNKSAV